MSDSNNENGQIAVKAGGYGVKIKGIYTIVIVILLSSMIGVLFFVWNGFASIDTKHRYQLDEMQIQSYILAECLRSNGNCPDLREPPGLADRVYRKPTRRND